MAEIYVGIPHGQEYNSTTTRVEHPLGQLGLNPHGDVFRWAFSGEAIASGQNTMQKVSVANNDMDLAVAAAAAVGDTTITVTQGATATTLDQYEDGIIYINDGAGEGHRYYIRTNPAASASASLTVTLWGKVAEALTTATSLAGLSENPWKDVEVFDADDIDGPSLGVAPDEIANNEYFWSQVRGRACCLMDATTFVLGSAVEASSSVDGAMTLHDVSANTDRKPLGEVETIVAVSTDYGMVKLAIE